MSIDAPKIDIETAELLSRRSAVANREVEFRRKLGIVFGDQVILALILDMYYGNIPGKGGYFWKLAEPIVEEFEDVIISLDPSNVELYRKLTEAPDTAALLIQETLPVTGT